ncbi:hypothetical protein K501DRAFT_248576 [Backusella circina FSU 941]|nr:hypothetical protein K501DRAFT_248576 [Backusella circina FSU 941]
MDTSHVSAENPQTITLSTKAKRRMRTTREETEILERFFADNTNPSNEQKIKIASIVQMGPKNVHFWFQNRRAKDNQKRKMIKENSRRLKESCSFGFHDHSQGHVYYEENRLHFKESKHITFTKYTFDSIYFYFVKKKRL